MFRHVKYKYMNKKYMHSNKLTPVPKIVINYHINHNRKKLHYDSNDNFSPQIYNKEKIKEDECCVIL